MEGTKIRLWKRTNQRGKEYLTGPVSDLTRLIVVENDRKTDSRDPDYYAFLVPNRGASHVSDIADEL